MTITRNIARRLTPYRALGCDRDQQPAAPFPGSYGIPSPKPAPRDVTIADVDAALRAIFRAPTERKANAGIIARIAYINTALLADRRPMTIKDVLKAHP